MNSMIQNEIKKNFHGAVSFSFFYRLFHLHTCVGKCHIVKFEFTG